MKNQKICIIGDGFTGLITSLVLSNEDLDITLFYKSSSKREIKDHRATAISESNYQFLISAIPELDKKDFWGSNNVSLFLQRGNKNKNFLNIREDKKKLMHIFQNSEMKKKLRRIMKSKNVKIVKNSVNDISSIMNYYDLIIVCAGSKSKIYENLGLSRKIFKNYNEYSISGQIEHKNELTEISQYFLKEGPFALLPINKRLTSFVWTVDDNLYFKFKNDLKNIIEERIKGNIIKIQTYPVNLTLRKKYFKKNVLILGEGLHSVHPLAGQGFNLILRDIRELQRIIRDKIKIGLEIKNSFALNEFSNFRKSDNILMSLGIDATHFFFKSNNIPDNLKDFLVGNFASNNFLVKVAKNISDKGIFNLR